MGAIGIKGMSLWLYGRELNALLQARPIQSLVDRLAYEEVVGGRTHPERENGKDSSREALKTDLLVDRFESNLDLYQSSRDDYRRRRSLPTLLRAHESTVMAFELAQGFGVIRTLDQAPYRASIEIPERPPVPLQCDRPVDSTVSLADLGADSETNSSACSNDSAPNGHGLTLDPPVSQLVRALTDMHLDSLLDFSNPPGLGYVGWRRENNQSLKDLSEVIGFQPHAFRSVPEVLSKHRSARWAIHELQLVSLLKHRPPAAYVSDNLPRMDELVNARTRPLDEFEADAVSQLQDGKDLVTREGREVIRMVGSIRASRQCLECHRVDRGALLGAFVYRLHKQ